MSPQGSEARTEIDRERRGGREWKGGEMCLCVSVISLCLFGIHVCVFVYMCANVLPPRPFLRMYGSMCPNLISQ